MNILERLAIRYNWKYEITVDPFIDIGKYSTHIHTSIGDLIQTENCLIDMWIGCKLDRADPFDVRRILELAEKIGLKRSAHQRIKDMEESDGE